MFITRLQSELWTSTVFKWLKSARFVVYFNQQAGAQHAVRVVAIGTNPAFKA